MGNSYHKKPEDILRREVPPPGSPKFLERTKAGMDIYPSRMNVNSVDPDLEYPSVPSYPKPVDSRPGSLTKAERGTKRAKSGR